MFDRINHVGIAVSELDPAIAHYSQQLGIEVLHRELLDDQSIEAALMAAGSDRIELVAPLLEDTPLGRFLRKRGPGMHHIAYEVDDIDAALATLSERDVTLIDTVARAGIHGSRVAFLHPSSAFGVLTEIV